MLLSSSAIQKPLIDAAIQHVVAQMSSEVVRIRYDGEPDWSGDDSVSFRILLSDEAARTRLRETTIKALSLLAG